MVDGGRWKVDDESPRPLRSTATPTSTTGGSNRHDMTWKVRSSTSNATAYPVTGFRTRKYFEQFMPVLHVDGSTRLVLPWGSICQSKKERGPRAHPQISTSTFQRPTERCLTRTPASLIYYGSATRTLPLVGPSACLPVCPSARLPVCLSARLSVSIRISPSITCAQSRSNQAPKGKGTARPAAGPVLGKQRGASAPRQLST